MRKMQSKCCLKEWKEFLLDRKVWQQWTNANNMLFCFCLKWIMYFDSICFFAALYKMSYNNDICARHHIAISYR